MVHLGYLDFVFMGGVGLCWLCCVTPLVKAVRGWRTAYGIKFVAISYVLIHSIELVAYGVPQFDPYWLITCVCLGAVLDDGSRRANVAATTVRSGAANITKSFQP
jgi:hypothetical protein